MWWDRLLTDPVATFTGALVLATTLLIVVGLIQWWITRDTARKQLRAYVALHSINFIREEKILLYGQVLSNPTHRIGVRIQNYGKTPSFDTSIHCNGSTTKPKNFGTGNTPGAGKQMLHPGMAYSIEVTTDTTPKFLESGWVWGHVIYRDIYERWWRTNFYYAYHRPPTAENDGLFTPESENNDEKGPFSSEAQAVDCAKT
jgi:hypothetical protein